MAGNVNYESDSGDFDFQDQFVHTVDSVVSDNDGESDIEVSSSDSETSETELDHEASSSDVQETDGHILPDNTGVWSDTTSPVVVEAFVEESGPAHVLDESAEPFNYFSLIIDEQLYQLAADQTNLYAIQYQERVGKADATWAPVTPADIKVYIHLYIMMGLIIMPEYEMYWSKDERLNLPVISKSMPKNRFKKISQYFHLNDSSKQSPKGHPNYDPLYKVRPFLDMVKRNIISHFKPGRDISIDEAMIPFSGRMKVWCAADPATGYLLNFDVYVGKIHDPMPHGTGHYIVNKVGQPFLGKNHHFFYDHYFSSVQLAQDLLLKKTYMCSTIRSDRKGWPDDCKAISTQKLERGSVIFRQQGNAVATVWRDKRFVHLLSTNTSPEITTVSRRASGSRRELLIPSTVAAYNKSMGGVSKFEQLYSYYPVGRKSHKWWRYIFNFLLQTSIINSWIIYSNSHRPHPKTKDVGQIPFRLSISSALLKGNISRKRRATSLLPASEGLGTRNLLEHRLIRLEGRCKNCYWCRVSRTPENSKKKRPRETVFGCNLCQIHLCRGKCFANYHTSLAS